MKTYILKEQRVVPASFCKWAIWFQENVESRTVAKTRIGAADVLTLFVGLHCGFDCGPPLIFETIVNNGSMDGECIKYSSWEQAERGHQMTIERLCEDDQAPVRRTG